MIYQSQTELPGVDTYDALAEGFYGQPDPRHGDKARSHFWKQQPECDAFRTLVKTILLHPHNFGWTIQGFGFLRTYLPFGPNPKRFRLNVWHNDLTLPGVSTIHDHPWDFISWIVNGEFRNVRFVEDSRGDAYEYMRIKCGETGGSLGTDPTPILLRNLPVECYTTGDIYRQQADEIHLSAFDDGTVTLNDRTGDTEMPRVFWPAGQAWVDAKPRMATYDEIVKATGLAVEKWRD